MAKVKVFVHATDADADADGRAMTLAPLTYLSRLAKKDMVRPEKTWRATILANNAYNIQFYKGQLKKGV